MKKTLTKILILAAVFLAAVGVVWYFTREEEPEQHVYTVMEEATLPVVEFEFEGQTLNLQRGYTSQMDVSSLHGTLTPLSSDRKLTVVIEAYGTEVKQVGFEVRTLDGERLIERKEGVDFGREGTRLTAVLELSDLLEKQQEYLLCVTLQTEACEKVCYYTRVRYYEDLPAAEMIAFAGDFSSRTFDRSAAEEIRPYLESSASADNGTLGHVTIASSFDQVTWGNLAPVREGEPRLSIRELSASMASITLEYTISAQDENGRTGIYQVEESFFLRKGSDVMYLMDYERNMTQEFELTEENLYGGVIDLGVQSSLDLPVSWRKTGTYGAYSVDGELWEYNHEDNSAVRVFSFKQEGDDGIRTRFRDHDFRIIRLGENGDLDFLVYGYMNRGVQEGQCGLAFFRYTREENLLTEVFFIPSDRPFEVMSEEVSQLSYVGEHELLYLVFDNRIYAIDFNGIEPVLVTDNLKEGSFVVSEDGSRIAWQEDETSLGCGTICVMYLDNGQVNRIQAPEGEQLRVLGFIGGDFIYGFVRESDSAAVQTLSDLCPMYALEIVDRDRNVQTRYEWEGLYISGITVENDRVQVRRLVRDEGGRYRETSLDSLILNAEKEETEESPVSVRADEKRQRVYLLNLASGSSGTRKLSLTTPKQVTAGEQAVLRLASGSAEDPRYFAYAAGHLVSISYTPAEAIASVYDRFGVVLNAARQVVWSRMDLSSERTLRLGNAEPAGSAEDSLRACLTYWLRYENSGEDAGAGLAAGKSAMEILRDAFGDRVMDLTGCTVPQILYYLDQGHPVLALTEDTKAELIVGYDRYNLQIYNPLTGQNYKMARDDALTYYGNNGNIFVTIVD